MAKRKKQVKAGVVGRYTANKRKPKYFTRDGKPVEDFKFYYTPPKNKQH